MSRKRKTVSTQRDLSVGLPPGNYSVGLDVGSGRDYNVAVLLRQNDDGTIEQVADWIEIGGKAPIEHFSIIDVTAQVVEDGGE